MGNLFQNLRHEISLHLNLRAPVATAAEETLNVYIFSFQRE